MRKELFKFITLILIIVVGFTLLISHLNALAANWCRGIDDCEAIEQACLEGEFVTAIKQGTFCYFWSICRTQFEVWCWDDDDDAFYKRSAYCDSPALWGECDPTQ